MSLLAVGINHKSAPVALRERVAFATDTLPQALGGLTGSTPVEEAAILSTCNRTELYCDLEGEQPAAVLDWFCDYHKLRSSEVTPHLYIHPQQQAVRHMLRVASGLDSLVLGEPQILGQMKQAYSAARHAGTVGRTLNRLFQHTFSVAKQVRTDTAIGASPVSVAFAAVSLAKQIFSDLGRHTALLIGAGETIELVARHLHENGIKRIIVANRTLERAHTLAMNFNGYAIALSEIPAHLAEADIVIASTASPLPILGKGAVESARQARRRRPVLMVDIAVPRDIEPQVGELDDIYLYTVDDLQEIIDEGLKSRQAAAQQAEEIIDLQVDHFMGWLQSLDAVDLIRSYRQRHEQLRDEVLQRAQQQLRAGRDPEQVIAELARQLTNKLMHAPCEALREAGSSGRDQLLNAARELFRLQETD